ncbi:hypothetical protein HC931_18155 [Candidatus Gracilibacteria bacterium]|nr:hypothetical protein [Candidatus Gracilibacteria bacterium]
MQILENTPTKLAIYSRPTEVWFLAASLPILGVCFIVDLVLQSEPLSNKFFSLVLIVVWIGLASWAAVDLVKNIQCTLDKRLGIVAVREQGLLGTKIVLRSLGEVKEVIVDKESSDRVPLQPVSLLFSSGEKLPVYIQLDLKGWYQNAQGTAEIIRDFIASKGHLPTPNQKLTPSSEFFFQSLIHHFALPLLNLNLYSVFPKLEGSRPGIFSIAAKTALEAAKISLSSPPK